MQKTFAAPARLSVDHYENFPVASWLCPAHLRAPIVAIYRFARTADDLADEGVATAEQRLADLAQYRNDLMLAAKGKSTSPRWQPIFANLQWAMQEFALPLNLLEDLLDAFVQDVVKTRDYIGYANRSELLDYCRRSANPIGRLLLHLYGLQDRQALASSDAICTALQLINFWQDLSRDIPNGRFYLPAEDCAIHQLGHQDMLNLRSSPAACRLIESMVVWSRGLMNQGLPLVHQIPGRAGWELRLVVQGGLRILEKIERKNFDSLNMRPVITLADMPVMAWRALRMRNRRAHQAQPL